jgi:hypothetical protein
MPYITADDLYLSAVSDGRLYQRCIDAARDVGHRKARFTAIINQAWRDYRAEVDSSALITSENIASAATLLEADRVAHVAELDAAEASKLGRWEFCGMAQRGEISRPVWRMAADDGRRYVYQVGDAATPDTPPSVGAGGYFLLSELLRMRGLTMDYAPGQTFRSKCSRARIAYHPEWDRSQPWASYIDGTAGRHFATPFDALPYFASRGFALVLETV